ncbi:MAG: hypothetical protein JKY15_07815 [Deltaproteobacteria bacterium]|nr:hypothetical protein [Deltaproteobacteria bacterium]
MKVYLAHTPEIPEGQKKSLESRSADRFERFIDVVAKAFEKESLFKEAVEERVMTLRDFRPEA